MSDWISELEPKKDTRPKNFFNLNVSFSGHPELMEWLVKKSEQLDRPKAYILRALIREAMKRE